MNAYFNHTMGLEKSGSSIRIIGRYSICDRPFDIDDLLVIDKSGSAVIGSKLASGANVVAQSDDGCLETEVTNGITLYRCAKTYKSEDAIDPSEGTYFVEVFYMLIDKNKRVALDVTTLWLHVLDGHLVGDVSV